MNRSARLATAALALALPLGAVACSSDDSSDSAGTTVADAAVTTEADAATTTGADSGSAASDGADTTAASDFDVNTASVDEIAAVLTAAGVENADRWAHEVEEYRPYDLSDPDLPHLRDELAKYNPAPGVVDQIVAAVQP